MPARWPARFGGSEMRAQMRGRGTTREHEIVDNLAGSVKAPPTAPSDSPADDNGGRFGQGMGARRPVTGISGATARPATLG